MNISPSSRGSLVAALVLAFGTWTTTPASADTSVTDYLKLEKEEQAHLLGSMLQSLAEDFQGQNQDKYAECLVALYTERSEARVARSPGMMDFLESVEFARENDPDKITIEEIITRQLVQFCGYGRKQ